MKNILVLTDFSEVADNAAEYAVKLAVELKANVTLFHAVSSAQSVLAPSEFIEEMDDDEDRAAGNCLIELYVLSAKLHIALKEVQDNNIQLNCLVRQGNVKECIQSVVADQKIDLIIMGARLYDEFPGFLFGTNIRGVVDIVVCPILLIHEQVSFRPIRHILYVTDLRYCNIAALTRLINFAAGLRSDISMLHACAGGLPCLSDKDASELFRGTIFSRVNFKHLKYIHADGTGIQSVINLAIQRQETDVLAVANEKYHFLNHLFRKNPVTDTDAYSRVPVLIISG